MDKARPAVVMHRDIAGRSLNAVLVAPLTTTIRDIPTSALGTQPPDATHEPIHCQQGEGVEHRHAVAIAVSCGPPPRR